MGYAGAKVAPSHISLPSDDNLNGASVQTPYSEYETPTSNPRSLDAIPDTAGDVEAVRKLRPESQAAIDPLSLHIIRRTSQRVLPKDATGVADVQVAKHSDEAEKENERQSSSNNNVSNQSVKSL